MLDYIPAPLIPTIYSGIIYLIVKKTQDEKINELLIKGINKASGWKASWIGVLCSIIYIGYMFIRASSMPVFDGDVMTFGTIKHEIYYHENIPSSDVTIVGNELTKFGYFNRQEKKIVQLIDEDKYYILKMIIPKVH